MINGVDTGDEVSNTGADVGAGIQAVELNTEGVVVGEPALVPPQLTSLNCRFENVVLFRMAVQAKQSLKATVSGDMVEAG